ncbi:MAG TPA: SDR family NAD(P)-dependent oxidoreductase [Thermomicrobiales bacterium]|nr:SDR family NAD(P)-dependent oxidoreductase [Thermomicrobiales bacterium]
MVHDRTVIVTGAGSARGIGREACLRLAAAGWSVAALDLEEGAAQETAELAAREGGGPAVGIGCDVTKGAQVDAAVSAVESDLPPVAALVNNAGITAPTRFLDIEEDEWDRVFDVNVRGTYLVTRRVLPGLVDRGYGRIVNLSSVSAVRGGGVFGGTHYSAAKAAVLGLTRALAREAGPSGVTCNALAPGLIGTDITAGKLSPERREQILADVPVRREGTVGEVASMIVYLCSEDAGFVTGATLDINGGSHIY